MPRTSNRLRAAVVATTLLATAGGVVAFAAGEGPQTYAFVARGDNPVDALAAAPVAGRLDAPVLLTTPQALSTSTADALEALQPDVVVVAGGTGAISAATFDAIVELLPGAEVRRVSGADRYTTAAALAGLRNEYGPAFVPGGSDLSGVATVTDLEGLLGPGDLDAYATLEDLSSLATADDLAGYATVDDLGDLVRDDDLAGYLPVGAVAESRVTVLGHGTPQTIAACGTDYAACAPAAFPFLLAGDAYPEHTFELEVVIERDGPGDDACVRLRDVTQDLAVPGSEVCTTSAGVQVLRTDADLSLAPTLHRYAIEMRADGGDGTVHAVTLVAQR